MALMVICIVIFSIVTFVGLLLLLAIGPGSGAFVVMIIGGLLLAASIYRLTRIRSRKEAAFVSDAADPVSVASAGIPVHDTEGRYCPYCSAEFDDSDDEVCPNCGGRTQKRKPEPQ